MRLTGLAAPSVFTFATLPATAPAGKTVWLSDIGNAIIGASPVAATGSLWQFDGVWRPVSGRVTLAKLNTPITGLTNIEAVSAQILLPAGFLRVSDRLSVEYTVTKSGTTDSALALIRIGTAGTTADTTVNLGTVLAAGSVYGRFMSTIRIEAATTAQLLGGSGGLISGVSATPAAATIANISNALYINFGARSNSTNDTVGLADITLSLVR